MSSEHIPHTCPNIPVEGGTTIPASQSETHTDPVTAGAASPVYTPLQVTIAQDCTIDTRALADNVRHYLKSNQIQWARFASLVLGVSQSRLSTLLGKSQPWHLLTRRVQSLYQRMQLWMDTRATYGNNPYQRPAGQASRGSLRGRPGRKTRRLDRKRKPRSLFELEENDDLLRRQASCLTHCRKVAEECTKEIILKVEVKEEPLDMFEEQHELFTLGEEAAEDRVKEETVEDPLCLEQDNDSSGETYITADFENITVVGRMVANHGKDFQMLEDESQVKDSEADKKSSSTRKESTEPISGNNLSFFSFLDKKFEQKDNGDNDKEEGAKVPIK